MKIKGTAGSKAAICVQNRGCYLLVTTHIMSNLAKNYIKTPNNSWYPQQVVSDCLMATLLIILNEPEELTPT